MSGNVAAENLAAVVTDDKEAIQNAEAEGWHCKEVHGCDGLTMIPEEREPALGGIWSSRGLP
jgi:hypothetical protein